MIDNFLHICCFFLNKVYVLYQNKGIRRKVIIKYGITFTIVFHLVLLLAGCTNKDSERIKELHAMPALWESTVLFADPDMPDLLTLIPMNDTYDATLFEHLSGTQEKTSDYIPEEIMAFALEVYDNKPREVTIRIGDRVSVLAEAINNTPVPVFLVRTNSNTYAWLYAYHIEDRDGSRIKSLK